MNLRTDWTTQSGADQPVMHSNALFKKKKRKRTGKKKREEKRIWLVRTPRAKRTSLGEFCSEPHLILLRRKWKWNRQISKAQVPSVFCSTRWSYKGLACCEESLFQECNRRAMHKVSPPHQGFPEILFFLIVNFHSALGEWRQVPHPLTRLPKAPLIKGYAWTSSKPTFTVIISWNSGRVWVRGGVPITRQERYRRLLERLERMLPIEKSVAFMMVSRRN